MKRFDTITLAEAVVAAKRSFRHSWRFAGRQIWHSKAKTE
jgi:hypothetical protein